MAQFIERGPDVWLTRIFLGRDSSGRRQYENKTVHGSRKSAEKYVARRESKLHKAQRWRQKARKGNGFVYFIESADRKLVKIGYSEDPDRRLATFLPSNPGLRLIGLFPGSRKAETDLHFHFINSHHEGEWFHLTDEIRLWIEEQMIACIYGLTTESKCG